MSETPTPAPAGNDGDPFVIDTSGYVRDVSKDFHFDLDGRVMVAHMPKTSILMRFAAIDQNDTRAVLGVTDDFLEAVLTPEDLEHIQDRLQDPQDPLDMEGVDTPDGGYIPGVIDLLQVMRTRWFARPTGRPTASSPSRRSAGKRSTGRARSRT